MKTVVVQSDRVVLPDAVRAAAIHIGDGRITNIADYNVRPSGVAVIDARGFVVLPGLVDTHVHINDPGRSDWEDFEHATRAAAAGGVTTVVDMPLNSIPATTTLDGFEAKLRAARKRCHVDVGFWGGVVPGNGPALEPLARAGVLGFKCFLSPSGVEEFTHVSESHLRQVLPLLARLRLPLLVHAELPALLREPSQGNPRAYRTWLESRPPDAEHAAIDLLIRLAREFSTHIHIVHLASADALPALNTARASGVRLTVETCPHYLTFAAEDIADGDTTLKCAPPIREGDHRKRLWNALALNTIDLIATDHSPSPTPLKHLDDGDFLRAWGGISSLQLGLAAVWTGAAARGLSIDRVARWMAEAPAQLAGLGDRKGRIAVGCDADLVVWDPLAETVITPSALQHLNPVTPYAGMRLRGSVRTTFCRGEMVFDQGRFADEPMGRELLRRHR